MVPFFSLFQGHINTLVSFLNSLFLLFLRTASVNIPAVHCKRPEEKSIDIVIERTSVYIWLRRRPERSPVGGAGVPPQCPRRLQVGVRVYRWTGVHFDSPPFGGIR